MRERNGWRERESTVGAQIKTRQLMTVSSLNVCEHLNDNVRRYLSKKRVVILPPPVYSLKGANILFCALPPDKKTIIITKINIYLNI